jgi:XTP/dITP diphosphohydrolase
MCLVGGNNRAFFARGEVHGRINCQPGGEGGFGYDPIFIPNGSNRTFAEMGPEEKDQISHRAAAIKKMRPLIIGLADSETFSPKSQ